jgi:hypothetical protein
MVQEGVLLEGYSGDSNRSQTQMILDAKQVPAA